MWAIDWSDSYIRGQCAPEMYAGVRIESRSLYNHSTRSIYNSNILLHKLYLNVPQLMSIFLNYPCLYDKASHHNSQVWCAQVVEGLNIVKKIENTATGRNDAPKEQIVIADAGELWLVAIRIMPWHVCPEHTWVTSSYLESVQESVTCNHLTRAEAFST